MTCDAAISIVFTLGGDARVEPQPTGRERDRPDPFHRRARGQARWHERGAWAGLGRLNHLTQSPRRRGRAAGAVRRGGAPSPMGSAASRAPLRIWPTLRPVRVASAQAPSATPGVLEVRDSLAGRNLAFANRFATQTCGGSFSFLPEPQPNQMTSRVSQGTSTYTFRCDPPSKPARRQRAS